MRTFQTTETNDLVLGGNGALSILTDIQAVTQSAKEYMQSRFAEMIHNVDQGIPFDALVWGGTPNIAQFEAAGRARLMQVPNVLRVSEFTARLNGDILSYRATIQTPWGEVALSG